MSPNLASGERRAIYGAIRKRNEVGLLPPIKTILVSSLPPEIFRPSQARFSPDGRGASTKSLLREPAVELRILIMRSS